MSAAFKRRRVVHAVAGHRHDLAVRLQRAGRSGACAPARPARRPRPRAPPRAARASSIRSSSAPVMARRACRHDPDLGGDRRRRGRVVAGDHDRADAGRLRLGDRVARLRAAAGRSCRRRRARPAPARRPRRQRRPRRVAARACGKATPSVRSASPASASTVRRISSRRSSSSGRSCRRRPAPAVQRASRTSGAPFESTVRRVVVLGVQVWRSHQLALGRERAPRRRARSGSRSASAARPTLRAATISAPSVGSPRIVQRPLLLLRARRCSRARRPQRPSRPPPAAAGSSSGCAVAPQPRRPARSRCRSGRSAPLAVTTARTVISLRVSVPVLSEQISVVEPSVSTADELAHDHVPLRHPLRPERQHDRRDRRQPLRHGGHGERDGQQQHVDELGQRPE